MFQGSSGFCAFNLSCNVYGCLNMQMSTHVCVSMYLYIYMGVYRFRVQGVDAYVIANTLLRSI